VGGLDDARTNAHTPGLGRAVQVDMLIMKYWRIAKQQVRLALALGWLSGKMQVISPVDVGES
jgi:hypothetical protein